jgi:FKBP-type peptidyl-prolyl cis-trans isomerase SlyD
MNIEKNTAVTLRLTVTEGNGRVIENGKTPVSYLHGDYDNLLPKVEAALEGQTVGFKTTMNLTAEEAFGVIDDSLLLTIAKKDFPPGIKVGGSMPVMSETGEEKHYTVMKIKGDKVMLDGNHPLAGKALRISLQVLAVRAATAEEIAHRHVHGEHGHHH